MRSRIFLCALILAAFTFQTIPVAAVDEGMWTFNNVPRTTSNRNMASKSLTSG